MAEYTVTLTIQDAKGQTSQHRFYLAPNVNTSVAVAQAYAQRYAAELDGAITGTITNIGIAVSVDLPGGIKTTPLLNSDVEEGRDFYYLTQQGFGFRHRVPTFDETLIQDRVQVGFFGLPPEVAAFVFVLTNPQDLTPEYNVTPSDSRDDVITEYQKSIEVFKRSRR